MPFDLALADLFRPYLLKGEATPWHAVLSVIYVETFETASGPSGITIRGIARFSGDIDPPSFDPTTGILTAGAGNQEGHPRNQPDRSEPWLDITDTKVEFSMTVPRVGGAIVASGVAAIPGSNAAFQPVRDVLDALDTPPLDQPISDYPGTGFTLDLVLSGIEIRPPLLVAAEMRPDGLLIPHATREDVVFHLPKIKLRLNQGTGAGARTRICLLSLGATGLDDPGALTAAELVTMDPPHAFIGKNRVVGFGFRSAYLDLSTGYTPPEVLSQFGFDDAWTGLYLPEIRLFFAPNGAEDFAVSAGVENLLIGLDGSSGITGDFDVAVINQGSGDLSIGANFWLSEGRGIGITRTSDTTATAGLPETTRLAVDIRGGRAPYSVMVDQGSGAQAGTVHDVITPATGTLTITITATDTSAPPKNATLTIKVARREPASAAPPVPGAIQAAAIETTSITRDGVAIAAPELRLASDDRDGALVRVGLNQQITDPATAWFIDDTPAGTGISVEVPLASGAERKIEAQIPGRAVDSVTGYFRFDTPPKDDHLAYSRIIGNIRDKPAIEVSSTSASWTNGAVPFTTRHTDLLNRINPKDVTITGAASIDLGDDSDGKAQYNWLLSQRRANGLRALLAQEIPPGFTGADLPSGPRFTASWKADWQDNHSPRNEYWSATITGFSVNFPGEIITGEVSRPATPPPPQPPVARDTPPEPAQNPDWFRSARLKVRIIRNQFVAVELSGQIDFQTGVESAIASSGATETPDIRGLGQNPADGITDFLLLYQTDPASQSDEVKLYIGADPADKDGLVMTGQMPGQALEAPNFGRNLLGMTTIFTPLLAAATPDDPTDGSIVPLVATGAAIGVATGLAEAGFFNIERVILFGGEGSFRRQGELWQMSYLFDVETAVSVNLSFGGGNDGDGFTLLRIPRERPVAVRYKAIGLSFGEPPGGSGGFDFRPVFDSSKGYTIDVSGPGAIEVAEPLGNILQVLGARIARTNPLNFEIDLGFAVDLGVISVDRARVRLPLDPAGAPELTAFGAGIKVPGVLEGSGYMEFNDGPEGTEIKGGIDVRLIPIKLRIAAQVAIKQIPESEGGPATGFALSLEVELPVAIPLAQSGFGIYGFLGMFAMHYKRDESGIDSLTPALEWLKRADKANGNPANLNAWTPEIDRWAFGAGITMGTMGTPIIFNVKGMFLLELPGPRVLLMVKANLLAVLPELRDANAEGTFLCVIDLDFGRGTLTIGISINFEIEPLIEIQIPIEAFFDLENGRFWHVYLGSFTGRDLQDNPLPGPVRASILGAFDGSGYVMLSGHGIPSYTPPGNNLPTLSRIDGFGIAAGLEVSLIWGNTSINLYLKVTAGFNAVLGIDPFYVGGVMYLRGELKLFIISISASAALAVQVGENADGEEVSRIDGEVCGKVDLFFFSIKGCVDFHLGEDGQILPPPPATVAGATLVSRSPALAEGSAVDRGVDTKIGDMVRDDDDQPAADALPVVPIDAIPVLSFASTPRDGGIMVMGSAPGGSTGAPADGFVANGNTAFRHTLTEIVLERIGGGDAVMPGNTPSVWWTQEPPDGDNITTHLALLNWTPNPTPRALERTEILENWVRDRWGRICDPAAPAAPVLWTFNDERLGPSSTGWTLDGVAWPDPDDSRRSQPPDLTLKVHETWRSGNVQLDRERGIFPAVVEGGFVQCIPDFPDGQQPGRTSGTVAPGSLTGAGMNTSPPDLARPDLDDLTQPIRSIEDAVRMRSGALRTIATDALTASPAVSSATGRPAGVLRNTRGAERVLIDAAVANSFGAVRGPELMPEVQPDFATVARRLTAGHAITRADLLGAQSGLAIPTDIPAAHAPPIDDGPRKKDCIGKVLASPLWDVGEPVVFGDQTQAEDIADLLAELGVKHGPLSNVIEVDSGAFLEGHILMWVNRGLLNDDNGGERGLLIQYIDDNGNTVGVRPVRFSDMLAVTPLPPNWIDFQGPWLEEIYHTFLYGRTRLSPRQAVCVKMSPPKEATRLRIGALYLDEKQQIRFEQEGRPYYIGAIELTRLSEATRNEYDETEITKERNVVEDFLGAVSGDTALMFPDSTYRLTCRSAVDRRDEDGNVTDAGNQEAVFWFRTDGAAPRRLDPWVLFTIASADEAHVFAGDNLKIIFASNAVDQLYEAYGRELRVRLKAASFRQVDAPGVQHPLPINPGTLENLSGEVFTPFEGALQDTIQELGPCIPVDGNRVRHSRLEIPIPLEKYTDYLLDIESVPTGAAHDAVGDRVFRLAFSTGQFADLEAFGRDFQATLIEHRFVQAGMLQAIGNDPRFATRQPQGPELDEALMDAGLEPMEVPKSSRIVIFWEQANPAADPQPAAVLLDAAEPLRRARPIPIETEEEDLDGIRVKRYVMEDRVWLDIAESTASDGLVDKIVFAPGNQRALITLNAGARGQSLRLDLSRTDFAPNDYDGTLDPGLTIEIVAEILNHAPWEEA